MDQIENIADIVKELRSLGMTQAEIAAETQLSQAYISGIENGKRGGRTPAETLHRAISVRNKLRDAAIEGRSKDDTPPSSPSPAS